MKLSKFTKITYAKLWIVRIIDFLVLFAPLIIYCVIDFAQKDSSELSKGILVGSIGIALIITLFNFIAQKHLRSPLWIIFLGLYITMDHLIPLIIMIAVASILDDFILSPLIRYYKGKTIANKAIDEREQARFEQISELSKEEE